MRYGNYVGQTAGQAPDYLQCNIVILPERYASDFLLFCLNNPKPCPLVHVSKPGEFDLKPLGEVDIRSDVPTYRVFNAGKLEAEISDISLLWQDDLVTFVLGCSFTFEEALMQRGFRVRHIEQGSNVPMFNTNIETMAGGIFSGPLVVTMRSFKLNDIPKVFDISTKYPHAHGAPVYWGDPRNIGINDLARPDYGDPVDVPDDEVPVFWACGVTPQAAIAKVKPSLTITHAPGCMLVTDLPSKVAPEVQISLQNFWNEADARPIKNVVK
ncbi:MAG: putative hydro-lyase [Hyphomicrobiales bacterium]